MAGVQKVTISVEPALLAKIDAYADENGMTRSGMISLAVRQYLQAAEVMPSMSQIVGRFAAMLGNRVGISEEEQQQQLDMLQDSADRILGKK